MDKENITAPTLSTLKPYVTCTFTWGFPTADRLPDICKHWGWSRNAEDLFFIPRNMKMGDIRRLMACFNCELEPDNIAICFLYYDEKEKILYRQDIIGKTANNYEFGVFPYVRNTNEARLCIREIEKNDLFPRCGGLDMNEQSSYDVNEEVERMRDFHEGEWIGRLLENNQLVEDFLDVQDEIWEEEKQQYYELFMAGRTGGYLNIKSVENRRRMFYMQRGKIV